MNKSDVRQGSGRKKKKRIQIGFFRGLALVLGVITAFAYARLPEKSVSLTRQQEQLTRAAEEYYAAQARNNQLKRELLEIDDADFIERTARREYGYCWYGEIIYDVENLEDVMVDGEFK